MIGGIKIEIDLPETAIFFVVEEYVVHYLEQLELIEYHVENYREKKIHFSCKQVEEILEAFRGQIEEAVWKEIENGE